jgi:acyl-CoA thioester hydrolase
MKAAGLKLWTGQVHAEWLDYNGHMTEHRYLQVFGESSDALYRKLGVDFSRASLGAFYTLESHIRHIAECYIGTSLWTETEVFGFDEKRLHIFHRLFDVGGRLLATGEHLSIHVAQGKTQAAGSEMLARIAEIFEAQQRLPLPERVGSVLRQNLTNSRL